jgi:peptidoglycan/xylan/chitin deacetylase (PgdA/CDA1 family)
MDFVKIIFKALREVPIEFRRFAQGEYPDFIRSRDRVVLGQQVPVFMFHTVEPKPFEKQLDYLRRNRFRTLSLEQFLSFLSGEYRLDRPSVLLTFDDGHKSWFEVGSPLLKKYGFQGVGFLVAGRIRPKPEPGPWLSWPEVLSMERTGAMSFESHSMRHDRVFVGPQVVDFVHPGLHEDPLRLDMPWVDMDGRYTNQLPLGTPIYSFASRFEGLPRMWDDSGLRQACAGWVERRGGPSFFARKNWRAPLMDYYRSISNAGVTPKFETGEEMRGAIRDDLIQTRETMEEKLGRPVRHFCYPWGAGSRLTVRLSREVGYSGNFWIAHSGRNTNRLGDSPFYIPRVKDDYIFRLPGKGRKSMGAIAAWKATRRLKKMHIY